jgi:hypothetical protein
MSDVSAQITRYRNEVRHAADLEIAARVFHDSLACDPTFMALGRPHKDRRLRDIVVASLSRAIGSDVALIDMCLTRIDNARFVHGAATAAVRGKPGRRALVLAITYFEEDDMGLCVAFNDEDPGAMFLRFTAHTLHGPAINSPCGIA